MQVVQDSVQELLQLVPQIKSNISAAIAMVPEVGYIHLQLSRLNISLLSSPSTTSTTSITSTPTSCRWRAS